MTIKNVIICLAALCLGCTQPEKSPTAQVRNNNWNTIVVFHRDFQLASTIKSSDQLNALSEIWKNRKKVDPSSSPSFEYRIDIRSGADSGRWLYDPAGYVQKLNIFKEPIYQIESKAEFNRILGIKD